VLTGRQALAALDQGSLDLVLMDIQMLRMDGLKLPLLIRDRKTHRPAYTDYRHDGSRQTGDREKYLAGGMDGLRFQASQSEGTVCHIAAYGVRSVVTPLG